MKQSIMSRICAMIKKCTRRTPMTRVPSYPINDIFVQRRSLYAMNGATISHDALMMLFEAARWAPSEYNCQPWRFVYARKGTQHWERLFNLLVPANQLWAMHAAALVVVISKNNFDLNDKPSPTHSCVTGAAWMNFCLQATMQGIVAHGIAGFDYTRARSDLAIPDGYTVEMMCVVGYPDAVGVSDFGTKDAVPSQRKALSEIVAEGMFTL